MLLQFHRGVFLLFCFRWPQIVWNRQPVCDLTCICSALSPWKPLRQ